MQIDLTFASLYAARDRLATLNQLIDKACADLNRIVQAPPQFDELVAAALTSLGDAARAFESRFAAHLDNPRGDTDALMRDAALYFAKDQVAAGIPALVARVRPASVGGMTAANRKSAVASAKQQLSALWGERESLRLQLSGEQQRLRDWRSEGYHNYEVRTAVEREQPQLNNELLQLGRDQDRLHAIVNAQAAQ